ncbi:MAG: methionyl-tRNA formyltransferase [Coprothermobacterota bacterium]|nr:methionyl-tRNA formyltransferase [Coprothermobacterota bacterium]
MKIIFFGTPEFALTALEKLSVSRYRPILVVTRPDSPQGRGLKLKPTPVKKKAQELGIPVLTPQWLNDPPFLDELRARDPDLFVVVAFPILPPEVLSIPKIGSLNIHPSLLPRYRGSAPVERAIMAGEKVTGVSIFLLTEKVDQGPILIQREVPIDDQETAGELKNRLAWVGADLLLDLLPQLEKGEITPLKQTSENASWAPKIKETDCLINWHEPAESIKNLIRALNPAPGAFTFRIVKGQKIRVKIWKASVIDKIIPPGRVEVNEEDIYVGCGEGSLKVEVLQVEGKKPLTASTFLKGNRIEPGETWG